jgi:hypothetical protein
MLGLQQRRTRISLNLECGRRWSIASLSSIVQTLLGRAEHNAPLQYRNAADY